jgi:hypothetical protein
MKYHVLLNVLDQLRNEATSKNQTRYKPLASDQEKVNNARSRAFIHLYMKVMFGVLDFDKRERNITDDAYDGGIDGYYIDEESKVIYLIQSKFRSKRENFENKEITVEEILRMDVNRILEGEECDENGNQYNGKIKQLQREVSNIADVARYSYKIILLANLANISPAKLRQLTGGYTVDVFDFDKSYERLVFPVISGTYFTASDISIPIDLSNKNAGSKISYTVKTQISDCEITVLFVPTIEIAKIMNKYKNSILKYNPRSYLDLEGHNVNSAIRETILNTRTNEFALYNNGITLLSDETYLNEKIGQKNKAQLTVKNPQIINGGQTSFTLSRIYNEYKNNNPETLFQEKEVLLKVITLIDNNCLEDKLRLIDEISNATNKQTPVINADKFANEILHQKIQKKVFDRYGLLYERKRGEFSDGLKDGYIKSDIIIERNLFLRLYYSANGMIKKGSEKRLFQKNQFPELDINSDEAFDKFLLGYHVYNQYLDRLGHKKSKQPYFKMERTVYAKIFAYIQMFFADGIENNLANIKTNVQTIDEKWKEFMLVQKETSKHGKKFRKDMITGETKLIFSENKYLKSSIFDQDVADYFGKVGDSQ